MCKTLYHTCFPRAGVVQSSYTLRYLTLLRPLEGFEEKERRSSRQAIHGPKVW